MGCKTHKRKKIDIITDINHILIYKCFINVLENIYFIIPIE